MSGTEQRVDREAFHEGLDRLFVSAMVTGGAYALLAAGFVTMSAGALELPYAAVSIGLVVMSVGAMLLGRYQLASSRRHLAEAVEVVE